jgi:site-specific DNA recombinase
MTARSTAIGYIRVTVREQAQSAASLLAQRQQLEDYCHQARLVLDTRLCEDLGVSGHIPLSRRPGGDQLLRRLAWQRRTGGPIRHVVVMRLAHLFCNVQEALAYLQEWDNAGITLHLVHVGAGDSLETGSPKGRVLLPLLADLHAWQHEQRADIAWEKKAAQQVYGPTPYGFVRQGNRLIRKDDEQETLAQIRCWQADGWSFGRIAEALNQAGVPSKKGRRWHRSTVRGLLTAPYPHEDS